MAMMLVKQCKSLGCDRLQIWLESGTRQEGVDLVLGDDLEIDGELCTSTINKSEEKSMLVTQKVKARLVQ